MKIKKVSSSWGRNNRKESTKSSNSAMMLSKALKKYNHLNVHLEYPVLVPWASQGPCQSKEVLSFQATDLAARAEIPSQTPDKPATSKPQFWKVIPRNFWPLRDNPSKRPVLLMTVWSTTWLKCHQMQNKLWTYTKRRALRRFAWHC